MKKNISINISGIIFHIEEDGYERLDQYLNSIKRYFSAFEESEEIILDIENRIAEIFLAKLNDGKQIITAEDVDALIRTMGNVSDFKAVEDGEPDVEAEPEAEQASEEKENRQTGNERLYRDRKRQIIGGVAAGIAHYLRVDPLWIRLCFLILGLGLIFAGPLAAVIFVTYLVLWALLPGRTDLEEDQKVKKIYRDPDEKVLGGVASGIANYFGISPLAMRILFLVSLIAGGSGFFIYVVLWIIVPLAQTVTEKLEMKGEPVTLENIENSVKRGLNVKEDEEESTLLKVLLFPFRVVARIIQFIGTAAAPFFRFVVDAMRILAGVFIFLTSLGVLYGLAIAVGIWIGVEGDWWYGFWWDGPHQVQFPPEFSWDVLRNTLSPWLMIPMYISALVPILFTMLVAISLMAKRWVVRPYVSWSLFGLWVASLITLGIFLPNFVMDFREFDETLESRALPISSEQVLYIKADDKIRQDHEFVDFSIYPSDENEVRVERIIGSQGRNGGDIEANINMIRYDVAYADTVLTVPHAFTYAEDAVFRGQRVRIVLYVPKGQPFYLDANLKYLLNTRFKPGYNQTYIFDEQGSRICIDCPEMVDELELRKQALEERLGSGDLTLSKRLEPFEQVVLRGSMKVVLKQGEENRMEVVSAQGIEGLEVRVLNDRLYLDQTRIGNRGGIEVVLTTDGLREIMVEGNVEVEVLDWKSDMLEVTAVDKANVTAQVNVAVLQVRVDDDSRVRLGGTTQDLELVARDRASYRSYDLLAAKAEVDATDRADVRLRVTDELTVNSSSSHAVRYRGNPQEVDLQGKTLAVSE